MRPLKLLHLLAPISLSLLYAYFTALLNPNLWICLPLLFVFVCLFIVYGLACYALFHRLPGYENYTSVKGRSLSVENIGEFKENQRRLEELALMMRENITYEQLRELHKEYIRRYQTPAFCNRCEMIRAPRTEHCPLCDKCVLRREKHSELIGMCVGANNIKVFMQYLCIAMVTSCYMVLSLTLTAILGDSKFEALSDAQAVLFAVFEIVAGAAVLLFGKEFFISYFNARENVTEAERNLGVITKNNNPFQNEPYFETLFHTKLDFFVVRDVADPNIWLQFNEDPEGQEN